MTAIHRQVKATPTGPNTLTGVATSETRDRMGDVVRADGVRFDAEMPLLWQHDWMQPIGTARLKRVGKETRFTATLAQPTVSRTLVGRLNEARESVKLGLVRGVSIGFQPRKMSFFADGGIDFEEADIFELSIVTVPAHQGALIEEAKSMIGDTEIRAPRKDRAGLLPFFEQAYKRDPKLKKLGSTADRAFLAWLMARRSGGGAARAGSVDRARLLARRALREGGVA